MNRHIFITCILMEEAYEEDIFLVKVVVVTINRSRVVSDTNGPHYSPEWRNTNVF